MTEVDRRRIVPMGEFPFPQPLDFQFSSCQGKLFEDLNEPYSFEYRANRTECSASWAYFSFFRAHVPSPTAACIRYAKGRGAFAADNLIAFSAR